MSDRYPGGLITKTPVTPAGPYQDGAAPGIWTLEQQAYWKAQGLWPIAGNVDIGDPYYNYVTMLLTGDGTNGAQNGTFLDGSGNFSITKNADVTQGSFSPYGSLWSNYFSSTSDYLRTTNNSAFAFGTGDFCVEAWVYLTSSVPYSVIASTNQSGGNEAGAWFLEFSNTRGIVFFDGINPISSSYSVSLNTWYHVAATRSGSTLKLFVNGVQQTSATMTTNLNYTSGNLGIFTYGNISSYNLIGYGSNLRIVKGSAVYTANFTPSTTPLTAISGTSLLTCQSNRFIDNSSNAFSITVGGTPSVQRFSPFNPTASYDTATIGGSGYFDRSSSLSTSTNSNLVLTGNFTVEGWYYWSSFTSYQTLFALYSDNAYIQSTGSGGSSFSTDGAFGLGTVINSAKLYQWYHVAVCRTGSTLSCFVNGTRTATTSNSSSIGNSSSTFILGGQNTTSWLFNGFISDFRIVNGTDVYGASNTTITVPTTPLTAITNTKLLCSLTNAGIYDSAMVDDIQIRGNTQISTSIKKYGTGSIAFDGTGDYLYGTDDYDVSFGTGDFTIEGWFYFTSLASESAIMWGEGVGWTLYIYPSSKVQWGTTSPQTPANLITSSSTLVTAQWYHIAITRSSGTVTMWIDGVSNGTSSDSSNYSAKGKLQVGISHSGNYMAGYVDDLRITKGYARYTTTFTPPTSAFYTY